jgi:hypothetical protein
MIPSWVGGVLFIAVLFGDDPDVAEPIILLWILLALPLAYFWYKWDVEIRDKRIAEKKLEKEKIEAERAELEKFEMQNTCKRCGKIWFLGANELVDIENQIRDHKISGKTIGLLTGFNLFNSLAAPQLGTFAQHSTTTVIALSANRARSDKIKDDFDDMARCPDCNSTDSERDLIEKGKGVKKSAVPKKRNSKTPVKNSKKEELKELKEMFEEGLIEEDEFKEQKNKVLNS